MTQPGDNHDYMTIREYFAVHILSGLMSDEKYGDMSIESCCEDAVVMADGLIDALNGKTSK